MRVCRMVYYRFVTCCMLVGHGYRFMGRYMHHVHLSLHTPAVQAGATGLETPESDPLTRLLL